MATESSTIQIARPGLSAALLALAGNPRRWPAAVLGGACASVILGAAAYGLHNIVRIIRRTRKVRVEGLFVYPIKGCRGHSLQRAELTPLGLKDDRLYMIVDAKGSFLTQREAPRMAMIHPDMPTEGGITLRAFADDPVSGVPPAPLFVKLVRSGDAPVKRVTIWEDTVPAVDQGDAAAEWLQTFLGKEGVRLVRKLWYARRPVDANFGAGETGFSDGFPALVTSQASVEDVNERTKGVEIGIDRFRTNVHVSGCRPFEEDEMRTLNFENGKAQFKLVKPCGRCSVPCVEPDTGVRTKGGEPSRTLRSFRSGADLQRNAMLHKAHFAKNENKEEVFFGQNALVSFTSGAVLEVGDFAQVNY